LFPKSGLSCLAYLYVPLVLFGCLSQHLCDPDAQAFGDLVPTAARHQHLQLGFEVESLKAGRTLVEVTLYGPPALRCELPIEEVVERTQGRLALSTAEQVTYVIF
jgi:hypothetical protein